MEILFTNKELSKADRKRAENYVRKSFSDAQGQAPGEYKTEEELDLISKTNFIFKDQFESLGISNLYKEIDPSSVHFLDGKDYRDYFPNAFGSAFSTAHQGIIVLNRDEDPENPNYKIFTFLHEAVHLMSHHSFRYYPERKLFHTRRVGFNIETESQQVGEVFIGLNEAITDASAAHVQDIYFDLLYGENATPEKINPVIATYVSEAEVLDAIILGTADKKKEDPRDVWMRFYKAQFTGNSMPFSEIESVFGRGSLRLLASYGQERMDPNISEDQQMVVRERVLVHFKK